MSEVAKPLNSEVHSLFMHECIHPGIQPHMYLCIHPSHHLSIQPAVHPSILICLPIHPFISTHSFTFYTFIHSSSHTVVHVHHSYIHLPTHSSAHLSVYIPPTHSYIHLFCCFKVLRAEFKTLCTPPNQEFYHSATSQTKKGFFSWLLFSVTIQNNGSIRTYSSSVLPPPNKFYVINVCACMHICVCMCIDACVYVCVRPFTS